MITEFEMRMPRICLKNKELKRDSPLAFLDFLSHRNNFSEEYVKQLMLASGEFGTNLEMNYSQSNGECDVFNSCTKMQYEIKTVWGQYGCKILSFLKDKTDNKILEKALSELKLYNSLEQNFAVLKNLSQCPKEIKSITSKMKKKKHCDFVLFYPFSFSPNYKGLIPATDIDAMIWSRILKSNNLSFIIYMIKPNFLNEFSLVKITKDGTSLTTYFKYNDFFDKYVFFDWNIA